MDCSASNTLALQRFDLKHLPPEALLLTAITRLDLSDNYLSVLPPVITRLQVSPRPGEALRSRGGSMNRGPRLFQQSWSASMIADQQSWSASKAVGEQSWLLKMITPNPGAK
jgi:Leucine-rich repeat (LRR) protein